MLKYSKTLEHFKYDIFYIYSVKNIWAGSLNHSAATATANYAATFDIYWKWSFKNLAKVSRHYSQLQVTLLAFLEWAATKSSQILCLNIKIIDNNCDLKFYYTNNDNKLFCSLWINRIRVCFHECVSTQPPRLTLTWPQILHLYWHYWKGLWQ